MSSSSSPATDTEAQSSLAAYLNDHLAGSKAAVELIENCVAANEGTPLGDVLVRLGTEIEADRATLEDVMSKLGIAPSSLKQAAGWMLEKLSRVRFNPRLTGNSSTTRLMELETLSLGIEGKRVLWKALQRVAERESRLREVDFPTLISRAESQRHDIEPFRLQAAADGLDA